VLSDKHQPEDMISLKYFLINNWREINFVCELFSKKGFMAIAPMSAITEQLFEGLCGYFYLRRD
jgi:hypothetical protein